LSEKPLVLVAHFDAGERERIAGLLKAAGAEVVIAAEGEEAARLATERAFALAVATCLLPRLSGFEVCRRMNGPDPTRTSSIPVPTILLSDVDDPYVRARARHVGAKRVLFGALGEAEARELLATSWQGIDPLELSSRDRARGSSDKLFRDLLGRESAGSDEGSLLAKFSDPLTGLVNCEFFALKVQEECKRCSRYGQPLALLVAQVQGFDALVEEHGRTAGDEALLEVAGVFLCESRDVDVAGRVGAARFHLLLPNTPIEGARTLAARIVESFETRAVAVGDREVPISVRVGVAGLAGGAKIGAEEFVRLADRDLASAEAAADGRSDALRAGQPVEPIAPSAPER
jgi:diguanylate cyclase (GGDEF)-like protein